VSFRGFLTCTPLFNFSHLEEQDPDIQLWW